MPADAKTDWFLALNGNSIKLLLHNELLVTDALSHGNSAAIVLPFGLNGIAV